MNGKCSVCGKEVELKGGPGIAATEFHSNQNGNFCPGSGCPGVLPDIPYEEMVSIAMQEEREAAADRAFLNRI